MRQTAEVVADVVVVGAGPAGWAMAHACAEHGLDTTLVAPRPEAVWQPTYGLWADQADTLPKGAQVITASAVWAGDHRLARTYAVLDNASVLTGFRRSGARVVRGTAVGVAEDTAPRTQLAGAERETRAVVLRNGERVPARVVIDATGQRRVLSGGPPPGERAEQTAYGVVVPAATATPLVPEGDAVFMRWGEVAEWPTFLYAVPLPNGQTLLEETSLARRPGLPTDELARRLHRRLASAGVTPPTTATVERVRFAVDVPTGRTRPGVVPFGVAAGMMHPATGYSVGDAFTTAPTVAAAIAEELPRGGAAAARAAHAAVWPPSARAVRRLREWGLRVLLALPPERVPEFFDAFFTLPPALQHAYLSGRDDLPGTAAAMTGVFAAASWRLRGTLLTGGWSGRHLSAVAGSAPR